MKENHLKFLSVENMHEVKHPLKISKQVSRSLHKHDLKLSFLNLYPQQFLGPLKMTVHFANSHMQLVCNGSTKTIIFSQHEHLILSQSQSSVPRLESQRFHIVEQGFKNSIKLDSFLNFAIFRRTYPNTIFLKFSL